MDNLFILSGLLLIVVIFAIFFPIHKHNTVHKTVPIIVRPSYWITPRGPSWYPPKPKYHYEYTSGPSYRHYYRHLNDLYKSNDNIIILHIHLHLLVIAIIVYLKQK
jgi:hypothetical protein